MAPPDPSRTIVIDCDTCVARDTEACTDCVVTHLCPDEPGTAVVIDVTELRALRMLRDAGLAPDLRHRRATIGA